MQHLVLHFLGVYKDLKEECDELKKRIAAVEEKLTGRAMGHAGDLTKGSAT